MGSIPSGQQHTMLESQGWSEGHSPYQDFPDDNYAVLASLAQSNLV